MKQQEEIKQHFSWSALILPPVNSTPLLAAQCHRMDYSVNIFVHLGEKMVQHTEVYSPEEKKKKRFYEDSSLRQ